jgi:hypothetical protein
MESRVMPSLGTGQQALLADQAVDQGRLAGVGTADDGDLDRLVVVQFVVFGLQLFRRDGDQGGVELGHALAVLAADLDRLAQAQDIGLGRAVVAGLALGLVGRDQHRLVPLAQDLGEDPSSGVRPSRASNTSRETSASSIASSVWARMRDSRLSSVTSSKPAVSISSRSRSPRRPWAKRRSRVTPGWSSTSASLRPARRLNRVDLPTLGRPTMASFKGMGCD